MKKYTQRLKNDFHNWRVGKNYFAASLPIIAAFKTLVMQSTIEPIIVAALIGGAVTIIGEHLYNLGMSWIETCESLQKES